MRVDLQVHSSASGDCQVKPVDVAARCRRVGLDAIFLTDHNTIEGALELQREGSYRVVVGEEILTREGEMIGLFLKQAIPPGLPAKETAKRIRGQGGLVYVEHPYDRFRRPLGEETIEQIASMIDIVEVFNGRADKEANRKAQDLCDTLGTAPGAGSDAHSLDSIGSVFVEIEDFSGAADFLEKLKRARIVTNPNRLLLMARALLRNRMRS